MILFSGNNLEKAKIFFGSTFPFPGYFRPSGSDECISIMRLFFFARFINGDSNLLSFNLNFCVSGCISPKPIAPWSMQRLISSIARSPQLGLIPTSAPKRSECFLAELSK